MIYGYARVSSRDQNLERQIAQLVSFGIDKNNIYCDKKSGKNFERDSYLKMINQLKPKDLLVIISIDRLGRNYQMIIDEWSRIVNQIDADIYVLDMPLLDTRTANNLLGKFISEIVLQILSFVAENERENIRKRQEQGIALAKERGVKFGRPTSLILRKHYQQFEDYVKGKRSKNEIINKLGISDNQFYYYLRKYKEYKLNCFCERNNN